MLGVADRRTFLHASRNNALRYHGFLYYPKCPRVHTNNMIPRFEIQSYRAFA